MTRILNNKSVSELIARLLFSYTIVKTDIYLGSLDFEKIRILPVFCAFTSVKKNI